MKTPTQTGMRAASGGIVLNAFLAVAKLTAGFLGHSYALLADGLESTMDVFSSSLIYKGLSVSQEPADNNHPYGHGRAETIAAAAGALILIGGAVLIAFNSILSLFSPRSSPDPKTLIVLVSVVILKEIAFRYLLSVGKEIRSQAINVEAWHHRSDMFTSLAAGVGVAIAVVTGWNQADSVAAILASGWMGWNGVKLLLPTVDEFMETSTAPELIAQIRDVCLLCPDTRGVDKVLVRKMGLQVMVDLHLEVDPDLTVRDGHEIAHRVKNQLRSTLPVIADVLIHIEPYYGPHTAHPAAPPPAG